MTTGLFLLTGLICLWLGGEAFVRRSVMLARRWHISDLMIGLTLVGFGTSIPELITSLTAIHSGHAGLAFGNIVGSNIANVLLIMGIAALIHPVDSEPAAFFRDAVSLIIATAVGIFVFASQHLSRLEGMTLLLMIGAYMAVAYLQERLQGSAASQVFVDEANIIRQRTGSLSADLAIALLGLAATLGGAWLFVQGADRLSSLFGLSGTFVGLFVVAIGTSLPELTITVIASVQRQSDVALGNIVGSNLFNTLAIPGVMAAIMPVDVPVELSRIDLTLWGGSTLLLVIAAATNKRITRAEGTLFLSAYVVYVVARTGLAST